MRFFLSLLLTGLFGFLSAQVPALSDDARISLMTVAPGQELYSTFGHSALRVADPVNGLDKIYNYGTFDFDQPNFYLNFCRGKLLYSLDTERFRSFERGNLLEERWMKEQVLALTAAQKERLYGMLEENALPQNKDYQYDFFYDNCATRIRDIVRTALFEQVTFDASQLPEGVTMRQLLRPYLETHPWTQFGIDLVLGVPTDRRATAETFVFLPDMLHDAFAGAKHADGTPLVAAERATPDYTGERPVWTFNWIERPVLVMCLVALVGLLCMAHPRAERIFDILFWLVLGIAGVIITFLWFFTDHQATKVNFNLMWALPTHLFFFWRNRRTAAVQNYFNLAAVLAALCLLLWAFLPQELPLEAMPIAALVVVKGLWRRFWQPDDSFE